jgi:uncharacterized Fe-S cluster-containing radical SAM superfamily protein
MYLTGFKTWRAYYKGVVRSAMSLKRAAQKRQKIATGTFLKHWRRQVEKFHGGMGKRSTANRFSSNYMMATCLAAWRAWLKTKKGGNAAGTTARLKLLNVSMNKGWQSWHAWFQAEREDSFALVRAIAKCIQARWG